MVVDSFIDLLDDSGHLWLRAWRCVNCGEVSEPGIITNRSVHRFWLARLAGRMLPKSKRPRTVELIPLTA
jgi:hypothetical protein